MGCIIFEEREGDVLGEGGQWLGFQEGSCFKMERGDGSRLELHIEILISILRANGPGT